MSDLADFLLARIADDEANTRACYDWSECGPHEWEDVGAGTYGCPGHPSVARQLANLDAKRQIVERLQHMEAGVLLVGNGDQLNYRSALLWSLRALALPYADHPDYCAEWRP